MLAQGKRSRKGALRTDSPTNGSDRSGEHHTVATTDGQLELAEFDDDIRITTSSSGSSSDDDEDDGDDDQESVALVAQAKVILNQNVAEASF